jgi:hypothetical protein
MPRSTTLGSPQQSAGPADALAASDSNSAPDGHLSNYHHLITIGLGAVSPRAAQRTLARRKPVPDLDSADAATAQAEPRLSKARIGPLTGKVSKRAIARGLKKDVARFDRIGKRASARGMKAARPAAAPKVQERNY